LTLFEDSGSKILVQILLRVVIPEKAKPVAKQGRKTTDLQTAGLLNGAARFFVGKGGNQGQLDEKKEYL
jgi:hypothetical protein